MNVKDKSMFLDKERKYNRQLKNISHCNHRNLSRGEADCGVFGGWPFLAYQYVMRAVSSRSIYDTCTYFSTKKED